MGKTVNSTLFRLETSSSWRSLYEEYNKTEIAYYLNQDLQTHFSSNVKKREDVIRSFFPNQQKNSNLKYFI